MRRVARLVVNHKIVTLIVFVVLTVASLVGALFVMKKINYDDTLYLPKDSKLSKGLTAMFSDFGANGNASLMVTGITIADQVELNKKIEEVKNVKQVIWIDDLFLSENILPEGMQSAGLKTLADILGEKDEGKFVAMTIDLLEMIRVKVPLEARASINHITKYVDENESVLSHNSAKDYTKKYEKYDTDFKAFYGKIKSLLGTFGSMVSNFDMDPEMVDMLGAQIKTFFRKDIKQVGNALVQIVFTHSDYDKETQDSIDDIIKLVEKDKKYTASIIGNAAMTHNAVNVTNEVTAKAMVLAAVIVLLVLVITTTSYWEPIILLITMGVAILLNMGTNIVMPNVSYLTNSVASVLQLALTMDYSIYLINRFKMEKRKGLSSNEAMVEAMSNGVKAILSASLTTVASFIALMFMKYRLGLDMGIVLAKGVICSMLSVFLLLPVLLLYSEKLIEKTTHRTFNLSLRKFSGGLLKTRAWVPFVLLAVIIMGGVFQTQNSFKYGQQASLGGKGAPIEAAQTRIEDIFGRQNQGIVLLSYELFDSDKNGTLSEAEQALFDQYETRLAEKLRALPDMKDVQSWSEMKAANATDMLPSSFKNQFVGKEGRRVVMFIDLPEESPETTALVGRINATIDEVYAEKVSETGVEVYHLGNSVATEDIKTVVKADYNIITYVALALVALIIMFAFKSFIIPVLLVLVIQGAVYINMSIPFFQGSPIVFVGYMLVSGILLGATIDYAIVLCSNYMENRKTMNKYLSMQHALADSVRTILTSSSILTFAGLSLSLTSKASPAVGVFGDAIFRGGILSFVLCITLLPQLLVVFDGLIRKTTLHGKRDMIDNWLAVSTPDVAESVVIPKTPRRKKASEEREQEIINAILAGIASHNRTAVEFEEELPPKNYVPSRNLPDYMDVTTKIFDDDDFYTYDNEEASTETNEEGDDSDSIQEETIDGVKINNGKLKTHDD